jgi:L-alanine-DL-glutamate epimerase-like enolase superfamily enzyme
MGITLERWPLIAPFRVTGHVWEEVEVVLVTLECEGCIGRAEAAGIYYRQDTTGSIIRQLEQLRPLIEAGLSRQLLHNTVLRGGARNALVCALWDLQAKLSGQPVWRLAQLSKPRALLTTFTCGADTPEKMADAAREYDKAKALKLKITGDDLDGERISAVRAARPDAWLAVDANQGLSRSQLEALLPTLTQARVALIEQPFPVGNEAWLDGLACPIPIAADESAQGVHDLAQLVGRFNVVNIKLDKCGGLTEGLQMAKTAHELGLGAMVGNMMGTSLAMAPAFIVGQLCQVVDLDAPAFIRRDRKYPVDYEDGSITCPQPLWGYPG